MDAADVLFLLEQFAPSTGFAWHGSHAHADTWTCFAWHGMALTHMPTLDRVSMARQHMLPELTILEGAVVPEVRV